MDIPEKLLRDDLVFHFTNASTAIEHILHSGLIRFSPMDEMNDPYEYQILSSGILGDIEIGGDTAQELTFLLRNTILKKSKLACFVSSKEISENSFKYPFIKPRSWAQYGDAQRGICLGFKKEVLLKNISKNINEVTVYENFVEYSLGNSDTSAKNMIDYNDRISAQENIHTHIHKNKADVYFRKYQDFSDEDEYRVVLIDKSLSEKQYIHCPIKDALECIILGDRFNNVYYDLIRKFATTYSANAFKLSYGRVPYMFEL